MSCGSPDLATGCAHCHWEVTVSGVVRKRTQAWATPIIRTHPMSELAHSLNFIYSPQSHRWSVWDRPQTCTRRGKKECRLTCCPTKRDPGDTLPCFHSRSFSKCPFCGLVSAVLFIFLCLWMVVSPLGNSPQARCRRAVWPVCLVPDELPSGTTPNTAGLVFRVHESAPHTK